MDISLIIPAYNEEKYIGACVESVLRHAPGKFKEIIVVDNASTDKTAEIARRYAGVRVVREEKKGLTCARQRGFECATAEYIAFIDADCRMPDRWFGIAEKHFEEYPHTISLSGPVQYYDGPAYLRALVELLEWTFLPVAYWIASYLIIGGNFIVRRDAIARIGGFNTEIAFYGEDADLARRLSHVGPVQFRLHLVLYTSMRRFMHDGAARTTANYAMNFLSHKIIRRSLTKNYTDVGR